MKRLKENSIATYKYEFFYDKEFTESHKQYYKKNYSDIEIIKFEELEWIFEWFKLINAKAERLDRKIKTTRDVSLVIFIR